MIEPQVTNLAGFALVALSGNQESAAALREAPKAEWRQLPMDRRDLSNVKHQLPGKFQPRIARTLAEQQKAHAIRTQKPYAGEKK